MQAFAHLHPTLVAGLALVDGYPNKYLLEGKSDHKVEAIAKERCGQVNMARSLESCGVMRLYSQYQVYAQQQAHSIFRPTSELQRCV